MADIKLGNLLYKDNTAPVDDTNPVSTKDEQAKDKLDELKSELQSVDGKVATETTLEQIDQRLQTLEDTVEDGLQKVQLNGNIIEEETITNQTIGADGGSFEFEINPTHPVIGIGLIFDGGYDVDISTRPQNAFARTFLVEDNNPVKLSEEKGHLFLFERTSIYINFAVRMVMGSASFRITNKRENDDLGIELIEVVSYPSI